MLKKKTIIEDGSSESEERITTSSYLEGCEIKNRIKEQTRKAPDPQLLRYLVAIADSEGGK